MPAIAGAWITGEKGGTWLVCHGRLGLAIAGLLAFRLARSFLGSTYARFSTFIPTPGKIKAYLSGNWRGLGHSPLGALSVFGLLSLAGLHVAAIAFYVRIRKDDILKPMIVGDKEVEDEAVPESLGQPRRVNPA